MPLPKPNSGETEEDFMGRCMGDDKVVSEYPSRTQRAAVCLSSYGKSEPKEMK